MNLQLSSNILVLWITSFGMILSLQGCSEREERAFISTPSASTRKLLEDLLPQSVVRAIHNVLPNSLQVAKVSLRYITFWLTGVIGIAQVENDVGSANALATGVALVGGHSKFKGNVYFFEARTGQWGAVCADEFDQDDANTVCRQLGFARGAREFYGRTAGGGARGNTFGPVPTPFRILSGLDAMDRGPNCAADGARLQDCPNFAAGVRRAPLVCPSNQVAGVVCVA